MIGFLRADNLKIDWSSRLVGRRVHVFTSPPYNLGKPYADQGEKIDDLRPEGQWLGDIYKVIDAIGSAECLPGSSFWINCNRRLRDHIAGRYPIHQEFMWVSSITEMGEDGLEVSRGRYTPVTSDTKTHRCYEWVLHVNAGAAFSVTEIDRYTPPLGVPYADPSNIERFQHKRSTRCRGDVWFVAHDTNASRLHPCPFPIRLTELALSASMVTHKDLVVDPWCGIGSAAVAADRVGANFLGVDLSADYIETAKARVRLDRDVRQNAKIMERLGQAGQGMARPGAAR